MVTSLLLSGLFLVDDLRVKWPDFILQIVNLKVWASIEFNSAALIMKIIVLGKLTLIN
jgi:hypothetical protein